MLDCGNPALYPSISSKDFQRQGHVLIPRLGGNLQDSVAKGFTSTGSVIPVILQHLYRLGDPISSKRFSLNGQNALTFMKKSIPGKEPKMLLFGETSLQSVNILAVMDSGGVQWVNNSITILVTHSLHC